MIFKVGDLVRIREDCVLEPFKGMLGLVLANVGRDRTQKESGIYYKIELISQDKKIVDTLNHESIFMGKELELVSRGESLHGHLNNMG